MTSTTEAKARRERDKITKESHVLRQITDFLSAEGIPWFRMNSGKAESLPIYEEGFAGTITQRRREVRLQETGTADLLAIVPAERNFYEQACIVAWRSHAVPLWIETKRPIRGRYPTEQLAFAARMKLAGCLHIWATDVSDVMKIIPSKGKR